MKVLFALYDKEDNFIKSGFTLREIGVTSMESFCRQRRHKKQTLFRMPLEPQDDIFKEEDEAFIEEFKDKCYTNEEVACMCGVTIRTVFRRKAEIKRRKEK